MTVSLGTLSSQKSKATKQTYDATLWILNYTDSNPNTTIRYTASDMILYVHSDASYLSAPAPEAAPVNIIFSATTRLIRQSLPELAYVSMDPFTPYLKSCPTSWDRPLKPKLAPPISMDRRPSPSLHCSANSATPVRPPPCK